MQTIFFLTTTSCEHVTAIEMISTGSQISTGISVTPNIYIYIYTHSIYIYTLNTYVTLEHKTSHKGQFFKTEINTSSES